MGRTLRKKRLMSLTAALLLSASAVVVCRRRIRRFGVRPFLKRRRLFGQYEKMFLYFKEHDEVEFFKYTRMSPKSFDYLLSLVEKDLKKHHRRKNAITPSMRLALTLQYVNK